MEPLDVEPLDIEPLDIEPAMWGFFFFILACLPAGFMVPFDVEPLDIEPLDMDPDDWPLDIEPLLAVCATAAADSAAVKITAKPAIFT
ncbi:MAG TPA: hypothetical protein VHW02_06285 [Rhizomicrobium sp.]|jgi:hypothetical protein|nr:hypothetical protein [Rhizomicrobium sp.]